MVLSIIVYLAYMGEGTGEKWNVKLDANSFQEGYVELVLLPVIAVLMQGYGIWWMIKKGQSMRKK